MVVRVFDGKYFVRVNGRILVTFVISQMLNSSLVFDIYDVIIKGFFDLSYEEFVDGIVNVVKCNSTQVILFDIEFKIIKVQIRFEDDIFKLKIWLIIYKVDVSGNRFGFYDF